MRIAVEVRQNGPLLVGAAMFPNMACVTATVDLRRVLDAIRHVRGELVSAAGETAGADDYEVIHHGHHLVLGKVLACARDVLCSADPRIFAELPKAVPPVPPTHQELVSATARTMAAAAAGDDTARAVLRKTVQSPVVERVVRALNSASPAVQQQAASLPGPVPRRRWTFDVGSLSAIVDELEHGAAPLVAAGAVSGGKVLPKKNTIAVHTLMDQMRRAGAARRH